MRATLLSAAREALRHLGRRDMVLAGVTVMRKDRHEDRGHGQPPVRWTNDPPRRLREGSTGWGGRRERSGP